MFRMTSVAFLMAALLTIPAAATDNGPGPKGSTQRKTYCQYQLLDCQEAAEDTCNKKGDKAGPYCLADGYGVCNTLHDKCLAKAIVVVPKQTPGSGAVKNPKAN